MEGENEKKSGKSKKKNLNRFFFKPKYRTDKFESGLNHEYINILQALKYKPIKFLEIGVAEGGSLNYFSDYFAHPKTEITGIDLYYPMQEPNFRENIQFYECDQNDRKKLNEIASKHGKFDVILDDGAHTVKETKNCFEVLFKHVKPGGYYLIEDWTAELIGDKFKGMIALMLQYVKDNIGVNSKEITLKMGDGYSYLMIRKNLKNPKINL